MRRLVKNMRGQAMVEMAIVLPILLAVVFGIIEFGNIYSHQLALNNLARQAVRTAVVDDDADHSDVEDDIEDIAAEQGMDTATVSITTSGGDVIATVDYNVTLITGQIIGIGTKHLSAKATMKAE